MADLPVDILDLIGSRFLTKDRICFRSVCKTWRSSTPSLPLPELSTKCLTSMSTLTRFPFLMYYGDDTSRLSFYHPIYNTTHVIKTSKLADATIRFAKDGWFIMLRRDIEIFFFNPLTDEIIDLPHIPDFIGQGKTISFSSVPTSPDCLVLGVVWSFQGSHKFNFIRRGESEWTSCTFKSDDIEFFGSLANPVFHNGVFYYLDINGLLGAFDPAQQDSECSWTILAKPKQPCNSIYRNYLVECNGELISVFLGQKRNWIKVFKLDAQTMTWKIVKNLGDKTLFVSQTTSISATCSTQEMRGLQNKVFLPRFWAKNEDIVFYSIKTGKFHSLGGGYNNRDYCDSTLKLLCTWINPAAPESLLDDDFQW